MVTVIMVHLTTIMRSWRFWMVAPDWKVLTVTLFGAAMPRQWRT